MGWAPNFGRTARCVALFVLCILATTCGKGEFNGDATGAQEVAPDKKMLEERLAKIVRTIAEAEGRAARAKEEARFFECKSSVERVMAEIHADEAGCLKQLADQARCLAEVEREKGDSMLIGCLFGLGAAYMSGGAATPYALSGCAAGRVAGEANAKACPSPECSANLEKLHEPRLQAMAWQELPQCGGWLGLEVETPSLTLLGGLHVIAPGKLEAGGLRAGDFLWFVDGQRIRTVEELSRVVQNRPGATLELRFVRDRKMYVGNFSAPPFFSVLGAELAPAQRAEHLRGARIKAVKDGAELKSDLIGFDVSEVDGREVSNREQLRDLLRYRRAGEKVVLKLGHRERGAKTLEVVLKPRGDRTDL